MHFIVPNEVTYKIDLLEKNAVYIDMTMDMQFLWIGSIRSGTFMKCFSHWDLEQNVRLSKLELTFFIFVNSSQLKIVSFKSRSPFTNYAPKLKKYFKSYFYRQTKTGDNTV